MDIKANENIAIKTEGLTKEYKDVVAVNGLSVTIEKGCLYALLGLNGAGKTTTVGMLSGLIKPTSGDAMVEGFSVVKKPARVKEQIGVSPQEIAIAPGLTVRENLAFICGVHGIPRRKRSEKIEEVSSALGLTEVLDKKSSKLSGGMQRRLSIGMAIINSPKILFLDEPTLGLDVIARSELWDLVRELKKHSTIILTTHYMEEAEALADRIGIIKNGSIICEGSVSEIKERAGADTIEKAFIKIVRGSEQ